MLIFGVETSCDETSVCIMDDNKNIYSHIISSQEIHRKFGGVVPELASRAHLEILQEISKKAFQSSEINIKEIDLFVATCGPGLIGPLLVGSTFTKSLSIGCNKPFVPINHIEGHVLSTTYNNNITYPHLSLLLTGGHTQIYLTKNSENIILLGESVDDAVGETFDKVAKILNLKYPGGPEIENYARKGNEYLFKLPTPKLKDKSLNMSFSGIKTAVNLLVKKNNIDRQFITDVCASFQNCISKVLINKLTQTINYLKKRSIDIQSISVVGGVSNNEYLKKKITNFTYRNNIEIYFPIKDMMSDNAAMITWAGIIKQKKNIDIFFKVNPRLEISQNDSI
ncbi:tRNA (adenosine(37)-N6)-threonylcarbamoyltransferase complex transferase subunit TsaD [bacterium]|nr:tRNA (adenosine(37)-N6)-threonylcarbamoyltransferase complex transferase subunit TsaD [bacterium]